MLTRSLAVLAANVAALGLDAQSPAVLWSRSGSSNLGLFGISVATAGDLDADGRADIFVGASSEASLDGRVYAISGSTGAVLWQFTSSEFDSELGSSVATLGDVDGDGVSDVIAGAPGASSNVGSVTVLSGLSGQVIWSVGGASVSAATQNLGYFCVGIGDVDADGAEDAWVNSLYFGTQGVIFSGRTGAIIRTHDSFNSRPGVQRACGIGDRNGDGADDYVFASPEESRPLIGEYFGSITVTSGRTGLPFFSVEGEFALNGQASFGLTLDCFGDMNGDGYRDFILGDPAWDFGVPFLNAGRALVISGADGQTLATYGSSTSGREQGRAVGALGDVTGDGFGDFHVTGRFFVPTPAISLRGIDIVDGRTGQVVRTFYSDLNTNLLLGGDLARTGDFNGDRIPDVAAGVPWSTPLFGVPPNQNGMVFALDLGFSGVRPLAEVTGRPCMSSAATMPRMRVDGLPKLGLTFELVGRALPTNATSILIIGFPQPLDLGAIGAPGCLAQVAPLLLLPHVASPGGYIRQPFALPASSALQGFAASAQWLVFDPAANALGVVVSDYANLELQM
jgi:hypothetical protein